MKTKKALIKKYLEGKCNAEEMVLIEEFLKKNPNAIDLLFPDHEWENTDYSKPIRNENIIYNSIIEKINKQQRRTKRIIRIGFQTAACLLLFMTVSYVYQYFKVPTFVAQDVLVTNQLQADSSISNLYYINSGNKPLQIAVSDGSQITLYPKSEVRFAENFNQSSERIIELKGKAKFEVAKDKAKPFRVVSNGLVTSALGTIFIVDELAGDETKVNLLEGLIEIEMVNRFKKSIKKIIKPNESLYINHQSAIILEEVKVNKILINRECYYLQNNQKIIIKNLAVEDILQNIEQNFGVELSYDKSLLSNKYFSGTFKYSNKVYNQIIDEINYLHKTNIIK